VPLCVGVAMIILVAISRLPIVKRWLRAVRPYCERFRKAGRRRKPPTAAGTSSRRRTMRTAAMHSRLLDFEEEGRCFRLRWWLLVLCLRKCRCKCIFIGPLKRY
jgi:hypothetical protein